jgi:CO/xanthine dehydrogenase FAD-binding subunit
MRSTYLKGMDRKVWAFAPVGIAAAARVGGATLIDRAADTALAAAAPLAHDGYKVPLARSLIRRALTALLEQTIEA